MKAKFFTRIAILLIAITGSSSQAQTIITFASGFLNPVGLTRDSHGTLWVSEAGTGDNDSRVSVINTNGVVYPIVTGLPSFVDGITNEVIGNWRALLLPSKRLAVVQGYGIDSLSSSLLLFNMHNFIPGVSPPLTVADVESVIHIGTFVTSQGFTQSNPYDLSSDTFGNIYVTDIAASEILKVDSLGGISLLSKFDSIPNTYTAFPPLIDPMPSSIVRKADGEFYVSFLTGAPYVPSISSIVTMQGNGDTSLFMNGFSQIADLDVDTPGNKIYVLELGTIDSNGSVVANTSAIKTINGNVIFPFISGGFGPARSMVLDGNGGVYVTSEISGDVLNITNVTGTQTLITLQPNSMAAYPNPFNTTTQFQYYVKEESAVKISITNVLGAEVFNTTEGTLQSGNQTFGWNGTDNRGSKLPSGNYVAHIATNRDIQTCKLVIER